MVDYPKISDVVICKITKINDYGVFVSLLEYDNIEHCTFLKFLQLGLKIYTTM